jgi:hypothetical protein
MNLQVLRHLTHTTSTGGVQRQLREEIPYAERGKAAEHASRAPHARQPENPIFYRTARWRWQHPTKWNVQEK